MMRKVFLPIVFLTFVASAKGQGGISSNNSVCSNSVIAKSPEPTSVREFEYRKLKNARYNSAGADLMTRDPNSDYFAETILPRGLPLIPIEESVIVVVGKVAKIQPYFSEDNSQIYTEIAVQIEEVLKNASRSKIGDIIILDKLGGAIRLDSGRVVRYEVNIIGLGNPCEGNRYVFFIQESNGSYYFIKGYELSEGKVYTLSDRKLISEKYKISEKFSDEKNFVELIRSKVEGSDRKEQFRF